jgi:hypothetical protein
MRHAWVVEEVRRRLADTTYQRLGDIGSVDTLRVLPLVDRQVQRPGLRGSALVDNPEALGVDLAQLPAVVLSTSMKTTSAASGSSVPGPLPSPATRSNRQAWLPTLPCR